MQLKVDTTKKIDGLLALAKEYRDQAILADAQAVVTSIMLSL
jgi:hypothetical protein